MAMFDIEDCKDVELEENETDREKLAKVRHVDRLKAKKNRVKPDREGNNETLNHPKKSIVEWLKANVLGALIAATLSGLIVAYCVFKFGWY
jgi:hypothetical protein